VVSSYAGRADVLRALDLGALDFVAKPSKTPSKDLWKIKEELTSKVIEAASAKIEVYLRDRNPEEVTGFHNVGVSDSVTEPIAMAPLPQKVSTPPPGYIAEQIEVARHPSARSPEVAPGTEGLIAVASSTGGPRALRKVLGPLARLGWPVAVVQHMPPRFTREFALRLERKLGCDIREAADGSRLVAGKVLVAPGGFHMSVQRSSRTGEPLVRLRVPESNERYIPSADHMFESAAATFGPRVVGVILTGMGNDGAVGAAAIRSAGGKVIAEDRSTAVVFGMPHQAIRSGAVDVIAPLEGVCASVEWVVAQMRADSSPPG
jgi:two-component system chemotaxis response regulator CheB